MSRILTIAALGAFALAILGISVAPQQGQAAHPGANGKIVFVQGEINGPRNIWTMNADGSGRTQLTFFDVEVFNPTWSPDGSKIAFVQEPDPDQFQLMIMNADGSGLTAIPNTAAGGHPSFYPSGQRILFAANGDLSAVDIDGSDGQNITNTPTVHEGPAAISPNGQKIAVTTSAQGDPTSEITVMDANGSNPIVISDDIDADVGFPQWSPDSSQVVFAASGPLAGGSNHEIVLAEADGSSVQIFEDPTNFDSVPNFSPDGSKLVFQNAPVAGPGAAGGVNPFFTGYIVISNTNLTGRQNISGANSDDYDPDWGPAASGATDTPTPTPSDTPAPSETPSATPTPSETASPSPTETGGATPTPTTEPGTLVWGDNNCSGAADPVDSLLALRHNAALSTNTGDCPPMGADLTLIIASTLAWGDVDCEGGINAVDSLKTLRYDAGLSVQQPETCPAIGSQVQVAD